MNTSFITINIFKKSLVDIFPHLSTPFQGKLFKIKFMDKQNTFSRKMFELNRNPQCFSLFLEEQSA